MISLNTTAGKDIDGLVASLRKTFEDLEEQLNLQSQVVINNDPNKSLKVVGKQDVSIDFASDGTVRFRFLGPGQEQVLLNFSPTALNGLIGFKGDTSSTTAASTTELPSDGNWSFHTNTTSNALTISRNQSGVIKSVTLT